MCAYICTQKQTQNINLYIYTNTHTNTYKTVEITVTAKTTNHLKPSATTQNHLQPPTQEYPQPPGPSPTSLKLHEPVRNNKAIKI